MEELVNLFHGFAVVLQPFNIMVMVLGIFGLMTWQLWPELMRALTH